MTTPNPTSPLPDHLAQLVARHQHDETVLILDFGSQTAQLIARRVRDAGVLALMVAPDTPVEHLKAFNPKGLILSGGPSSVDEEGAPRTAHNLFDIGVPILGICYGMQLACTMLVESATGGSPTVDRAHKREFGRATLNLNAQADAQDVLFKALPESSTVWMSHGDQVTGLDQAFTTLASTDTCPYAAVRHNTLPFVGVQFHPEVTHTAHGEQLLHNFLYEMCQCTGGWTMANFVDHEVERIRERVGDAHVICGLSGGVDSSVCAALLHKAIGHRLHCVFVDNGLLRLNERDLVETTFKGHFNVDLHVADAEAQFLDDLAGIADPQEKRKRIGHRFIEVFKEAAADIPQAKFLAQGTLYPDVIESGHGHAGKSANIKLHHNVGGLPEELGFELVEPLRDLFKDEVRRLGEVLGLSEAMVWRHPFPGPGLAVRCLGEVTKDKLEVLRAADAILIEEITAAGLYRQTSQTFVVLLPVQSVGVMGDGRTYENAVAVRSVDTTDFMTADWSRIPYDVLARISNRIINEVRGINRVVYDISSKPPATIEWE